MKPPDELELSLPRLGLPLVRGVEVPGGERERFGWGPGEDVPGERESGGTYRCEDGLGEKGSGVEDVGFVECEVAFCDCDAGSEDFVVIVRGLDEVAFAAVVETWAVETKELGDIVDEVPLDLAWKVGLVRARKAEKKFVKKGRLVGMLQYQMAPSLGRVSRCSLSEDRVFFGGDL